MIQLLRPQRQMQASSELAAALGACRRAFLAIGLFSGMSNILMLTGSLFMLEVYDRVLPSRSVPTLVALLILTAGLTPLKASSTRSAAASWCASGLALDETMSGRVYDAIVRLPLKIGAQATAHNRSAISIGARLPVRRRPLGLLRPALAAGLSRRLFPVSSLYRH